MATITLRKAVIGLDLTLDVNEYRFITEALDCYLEKLKEEKAILDKEDPEETLFEQRQIADVQQLKEQLEHATDGEWIRG